MPKAEHFKMRKIFRFLFVGLEAFISFSKHYKHILFYSFPSGRRMKYKVGSK